MCRFTDGEWVGPTGGALRHAHYPHSTQLQVSSQHYSATVCMLYDLPTPGRASCDFWSVTQPSAVTRYTLTVSAAKPEDCITHPDPVLARTTPTEDELGLPTVEVGRADSIWDDLLPPPTKKVKVHSPSPPRTDSLVTKLTNGISVDTPPTTIVSNMTFVPYLKDSTLLLYPAQHLNGLSPNSEHPHSSTLQSC